jgi:arginyl-tRNA synthetase
MEIQKELQKLIKHGLKQAFDYEIEESGVVLERPANSDHGDWATNVALTLAKELKKSPREIAEKLVEELRVMGYELKIDKIEVAGPGFINFYISPEYFKNIVNNVMQQKNSFGKASIGKGKKVMVEFGQPNTHKAFHAGHLKSAISGLSMVKLHENLGFDVIKANYYGDVGMQAAKATWGFLQKGEPEGFKEWHPHKKMSYIDECYVFGASKFKEDLKAEEEIREINKEIYKNSDTEVVKIYKALREWSLEHQDLVWETLGIVYDRQYPESEVAKDALEIVNKYKGELFTESEGAIIYDGAKVGLTTWVFITKDGNPTYSAKDLGLGYKKFEEYPDLSKSIVTTSVEIADYFKVVIHILNKIKPETNGKYFHIPFGWLLFGKKKLSSRSGGVPKGMEIIDEIKQVANEKISKDKTYTKKEREEIVWKVAIAGLKFLILSHEFHKDINYDPEKFLSMEGYSGPYILYSYTRAKSILKQSEKDVGGLNLPILQNVLNEQPELELLRTIERYSEISLKAGIEVAPHMICNYIYELAQKFNKFYTECPVLNASNEDIKASRLLLTAATAQVLRNGLNLLGIETVEKM